MAVRCVRLHICVCDAHSLPEEEGYRLDGQFDVQIYFWARGHVSNVCFMTVPRAQWLRWTRSFPLALNDTKGQH